MYTVKIANDNDIPRLIEFFRGVYSPSHILTEKKYLDWQYKNAAANIYYPEYPNLLLKKNDQIVGHLGLIPYKFKIKKEIVNAAFLASLIVDKNLRSHGAGVMLVREAEKYFDLLYTTGFNPNSVPVLKYCGWKEELWINRWVYNVGGKRVINNNEALEIKKFNESWNESWKTLKLKREGTIDRNSDYLNWRFVDNPYIRYKIYGLKNNKGYVILRIEKGDEYSACRIVDLISEEANARALFLSAINYAIESKVDFIDFFSFPVIYEKSLRGAGFNIYDPAENPDPPIFLLPINRERLALNFSYKQIKGEDLRASDWLVVKSDGDRDRAY
ncbi:hypothetical protein A2W48_00420 [Candidatus Giovannonibacteria bacterium RIFCSPHIGHO2_12_44_12]|uniref:N-acetyltransferase domain-containing protein n=2 Tax=Candidatus Giovannoniibacteriota TaxID=1752738 RepID=A0A1F5X1T6_9BACT|nr:MAG: hypothetical protein A2W48_00420 [Candidatus Giovannonibacteria bacterium RIFCSPHIGHO2_12_44_12]OGF85450.1 MAG: hypothetical protein A2Z63_01695 [Candidatus Giovannonibacteria bacterium RIFCSPLOWO2_02_44_8]